jgi:hypothetical protein
MQVRKAAKAPSSRPFEKASLLASAPTRIHIPKVSPHQQLGFLSLGFRLWHISPVTTRLLKWRPDVEY